MEYRKIPWFGVVLILFGATLLFKKLGIISFELHEFFWSLLMLLGIVGVGRGYAKGKQWKIFWGTVLFLYSLFFLLVSLDTVDVHYYMFFPATFLIFGVAFIMIFLQEVKNWFFLIPAFFLCGIGMLVLFTQSGYLYRWEVWEAVHLYWPIALILFGIALIFRRRKQRVEPAPTEPSGTSTMTLS